MLCAKLGGCSERSSLPQNGQHEAGRGKCDAAATTANPPGSSVLGDQSSGGCVRNRMTHDDSPPDASRAWQHRTRLGATHRSVPSPSLSVVVGDERDSRWPAAPHIGRDCASLRAHVLGVRRCNCKQAAVEASSCCATHQLRARTKSGAIAQAAAQLHRRSSSHQHLQEEHCRRHNFFNGPARRP